ncbi:NAD metabolism ATPase/kinase [Glaciecola nitratireducens FR1064]|uniref:NAD metabolism ATPase/kinase n=1 Tax=Glaciecola nitratireducens (strain JCM 12485 / KCTC 12276 / FR1064) TaxID=1085623 RepID=G4QI86_GLANF|nr:NAD metabolism ATPase/kinase [Glaciecola nitratireducens FR1064]
MKVLVNKPLNISTAELRDGQALSQSAGQAHQQADEQYDVSSQNKCDSASAAIQKVVFMGAPSTGKSTICQAAAKHFNTAHVDEFGRTYWEQHQDDRRLTPEQLLYIAEEHIAIEDRTLAKANKYLFVDTNALTTWHFALDYHDSALPELCVLADKSKERYQHVFLCADDIPFEDTWERSGDVKHQEFQVFITNELEQRNIAYTLLTGSVEQRLAKIVETLA